MPNFKPFPLFARSGRAPDGVVLLRSGLQRKTGRTSRGRVRVVVARGALRIKHLDLSALPAAEQLGAARLQALAWSPFDHADVRFVVASGQALLLAWNSEGLDAQARALGLDPARWSLLPEPLLCSPPTGRAVRLLQGLEGYEGQVWRAGMLVASRWWPQVPDLIGWEHFLRGAGQAEALATVDHVPPATLPVWLARPWASIRGTLDAPGAPARAERWLVAGAALVAVAATAGQLRLTWDQQQRLQALQSERDALAAAVAPVLGERSQALALAGSAKRLAGRLEASDPLGVMAHLASVLPREAVLLKELVVEGSDARIVLELPTTLSRAVLVSALQSRGLFTEVSESTEGVQRGWVAFTFKFNALEPPRAPAAASAPASGARA